MNFSDKDIVTHWGEFDDETELDLRQDDNIAKKQKLDEVVKWEYDLQPKRSTLKIKNPLITQTVEVMQQTEMLNTLIDTYSNKSGSSNYLVNPGQMIPEVNFPPENEANLLSQSRIQKPIWFVPPLDTPFSRGQPQPQPRITNHVGKAAFRKVVCGMLRVAGFTDTSEAALVMFGDAVEHYLQNFIDKFHGTDPVDGAEERDLQIAHVEKGYFDMTGSTLTELHNYYKHNVVERNCNEIAEFHKARNEYKELMKESQSVQKFEFPEFNVNDMKHDVGSNSSAGNSVSSNATVVTVIENPNYRNPGKVKVEVKEENEY